MGVWWNCTIAGDLLGLRRKCRLQVKPLSGCYGDGSAYLAWKSVSICVSKVRFSGWITYDTKRCEQCWKAYKFIELLLRPENAKLVLKNGFLCRKAKALLSPEIANNPTLFPICWKHRKRHYYTGDVLGEASGYSENVNKLKPINQMMKSAVNLTALFLYRDDK